ncbi:MAG: Lrp/AsnC family transcriptional regulator [Paracoccaceae bacterium]
MTNLNSTDRQLIAALTQDGRASVTTLSGKLGVSRATVQTRLDRLISSGVIRRFTVELDAAAAADVIRAVMMIEVQGAYARAIVRSIQSIPQIVSLHSTNGAWDLVAMIETVNLPEFDRTLREVRELTGVLNSETCLLLDTAKG